MDGKFFTKETKDLLVDILDGITKAGILEPVDGPAYRIIINQIDKYADKVVPDEFDGLINQAAHMALIGQFEEAAGIAGGIIDELINIEVVSDEIEKLVFVDGLKFIVRQLILFIEKKKQ